MDAQLIIALASLVLSIYTLIQTRKHTRLSVVPHLDWNHSKERSNEGITFRSVLRSTGPGPAIIMDRWFELDGKRYQTELADPVEELAAICLKGKTPYFVRKHGVPGAGTIMPPGSEICIVEVFIPKMTADQEKYFDAWAARADFAARYQSLHGEPFNFSTAQERARNSPPNASVR